MDTRRFRVLTGLTSILFFFSATVLGVKWADGAFRDVYQLEGVFAAAGQGLIEDSNVKIHGVNIGRVAKVRFEDGQARVRMDIDAGQRVPVGAKAIIRPKTLFGEKFVDIDPGATEASGPYLDRGDRIDDTRGGFELEAVLGDTYPLLKAVDPAELMTVLSELADAGDDLGETINRSIVNGSELASTFAGNAEETEQFLESFAEVSDELAASADDLLAIADAGNVALPTLNEREGDVVALLQQAGRLSNDVADLLEANRPFVDAAMVDGSRSLQVLYDERSRVIPLVSGLRSYLQSLASAVRIEVGDGTLMGAVKAIMGGDLCVVLPCPGTEPAGAPSSGPSPTDPTPPLLPDVPIDVPLDLDVPSRSTGGVGSLLERVLGG